MRSTRSCRTAGFGKGVWGGRVNHKQYVSSQLQLGPHPPDLLLFLTDGIELSEAVEPGLDDAKEPLPVALVKAPRFLCAE